MKVVSTLVLISFLTIIAVAQLGTHLKGRVTDKDGPIAGAVVTLISSNNQKEKYTTSTNALGEYNISPPPGTYYVSASYTKPNQNGTSPTVTVRILYEGLETDLQIAAYQPIRETVTISADSSQPLDEVSKTVNVIDGQEMRDRADITLVDSLRTIPGFRVQQLGGFGRTASIKSRGLRSQDTAILIDGMRFRDAASITGDASAFLSDFTLTSVSKVEVLRGPGSSLYGTNSIGGTVDFQTPVPQNGWHGQVSGALGGLGLGRFRGNVSKGTSNGKFGFNAAVSRTVYTKGIDGDDKANNTNFQSRFEFNPFSKTNISARFFLSDAFVALNSSPDTLGTLPTSSSIIINANPNVNFVFDANDPDNSQKSKFFNGQFVLTQVINDQLTFQGSYSGLTTRRTNDNGVLGTGFQSASTSVFKGTIHTANGHIDWAPNSFNRFTAGYEFEQENFRNEGSTPSGTEDFFTAASQSSNTLYFQDLVRLLDGKLQFAGGFRAQWFSLKKPIFSSVNFPKRFDNAATPPAAYTGDGSVSYYFARTGTKIRAHVGTGYRVPSLYERFGSYFFLNSFFGLGNPALKPERSTAFDAGIDQNILKDRVMLTATYFYSEIKDEISYLPTDDLAAPSYFNFDKHFSRGVEFSSTVKPTNSTDIFASYTFTNSDVRNHRRQTLLPPFNIVSQDKKAFGIPASQFTLTATQRIKRFWVNADFVGTSSYLAPIFSNSTFGTYIYRFAGNRRLDLTAGYTFPIDKDKFNLRVFGTIENLLDYEYFENGFRTVGINGRVGVSFGF